MTVVLRSLTVSAACHDAIQPEKVPPDGADKGEEPAEGMFPPIAGAPCRNPVGVGGRGWDEAIPG